MVENICELFFWISGLVFRIHEEFLELNNNNKKREEMTKP